MRKFVLSVCSLWLCCGLLCAAQGPDAFLAKSPRSPAELQLLFKLARSGGSEAQNEIGLAYAGGIGTERNDVEAVKWFLRAAQRGLAVAQANLGIMYLHGRAPGMTVSEALLWLRKAAGQGDTSAQYHLGHSYLLGTGGNKNLDEALKWLM